jgi:environmental stress-induced protein Ves
MRHLRSHEFLRVPWRNGRGHSLELASEPSTRVRDFAWRVSLASIVEDGPFSDFPGVERILVVLDDGALELDHGPAAPKARVGALAPYSFSGAWPTTCRLLHGPLRDLKVMARSGEARATVEVLRAGSSRHLALDGKQLLAFAARGTSTLDCAGHRAILEPGSLAHSTPEEDPHRFTAWTDDALILVRVDAGLRAPGNRSRSPSSRP